MLQYFAKSRLSLKYMFLGIFVIYVTITVNMLSWISRNHKPERKIRAVLLSSEDTIKDVKALERADNAESDTEKEMEINNHVIFENSMKRKRKILAELIQEYQQSKEVTEESKFTFQPIGNISVFSAFYDDRLNLDYEAAVVRVLGISRLDSLETLVCRYTDKGVDSWVLATKYQMCENHDRTYGGFVYICNAPRNLQFVPRKVYVQSLNNLNTDSNGASNKSVSLDLIQVKRKLTMKAMDRNYDYGFEDNFYRSEEESDFDNDDNNDNNINTDEKDDGTQDQRINKSKTNSSMEKEVGNNITDVSTKTSENVKTRQLLSIDMQIPSEVTTKQSNGSTYNIAVCVPPLFGDIKISEFIQFVEFHKLQKVNHFYFYTMNISSDLAKVLKYYQDENMATVIKWTLPSGIGDKIWNSGQIIAIQDCLYRTIGYYDYVAFLDIDEIIVPKVDSDWSELLQRLHKKFPDNEDSISAGFSLKSAFFNPDKISTDSMDTQRHVQLSFLDKINRNEIISSVRTKLIVQPEYIAEMGIHHVSVTLNMYVNVTVNNVSPSTALIHHYRPCTTVSDKRMICEGYIQDDSILKFEKSLVLNYMEVVKENIKKFRHA